MDLAENTPLIEREVSIARLHGQACWHCGDSFRRLHPVGSVRTPVEGGVRVWPVVACADHRGEALQ